MSQKQTAVRQQEEVLTPRKDFIDLLATKIAKTVREKAQQPVEEIKAKLPSDAEAIRDLPFYNATLNAIKNQRDVYLVGSRYAERRQMERESEWKEPPLPKRIPFDATALGGIQIAHLGAWFIPSETVRSALLPIVVTLPNGVLKEPIVNAVVSALPLAQPSLDQAVKGSVLDFLKTQHWREVLKNQTRGYMIHRDSSEGEPNYQSAQGR